MYQELIDLIIEVAEELNTSQKNKIPVEKGADAPLYGKDGVLDSVGLVTFVVAVEEAIEDRFGTTLVLADEKAMSQRSSPFLTIGSLGSYAEKLIKEQSIDA